MRGDARLLPLRPAHDTHTLPSVHSSPQRAARAWARRPIITAFRPAGGEARALTAECAWQDTGQELNVPVARAHRLETPPEPAQVPAQQQGAAASPLAAAAALRIQRVVRGHAGRMLARQVILDMYSAYDVDEPAYAQAAAEEGRGGAAEAALDLGPAARDVSGSFSPCSDLCVQARHVINSGDLEAARQLYLQAQEHSSAHNDMRHEIAEALPALEAILLGSAPSGAERCGDLCRQAKDHLAGARVEAARTSFTAALLCEPNHFEALIGRAAVWVRMREYARAVQDASTASAIDDGDARVHSVEGAARLGLGDMQGARRCFLSGLGVDAHNKFMASGLEAVERILEQQRQQQAEGQAAAAAWADQEEPPDGRSSQGASPIPSHRSTRVPSHATQASTGPGDGADLPPRVPGTRLSRPSSQGALQTAPADAPATIPTRLPSDLVSSRAPSHASSDGQLAQYPQSAFARDGSVGSDASSASARKAKRTPSPFLFKNLEQKAATERAIFLASALPLDRAVPLLQGVLRRMAVARVSSYWHTYRDDVRGRQPHELRVPKGPGRVRGAGKVDLASSRAPSLLQRPGQENIGRMLAAVCRLQAAARGKLAQMLFASGRLWFAHSCASLTQLRHKHQGGVGGGAGALHDMLVELLLEDGGMVRKEHGLAAGLAMMDEMDQTSVGNFAAFGIDKPDGMVTAQLLSYRVQ